MAPTPLPEMEEHQSASEMSFEEPLSGEEVVISGLAGKYPDSDSTEAFMQNLFNQVDMISDDDRRWKLDHPEIPQRTGKINGIIKFDAQFFGVHYKQAWTMDPMCRQLLESAYSAVIDAGMNPRTMRNTKTGVFVGSNYSESEKTWFYEKAQVNGFGIVGCSRAMLANRLSYWLGTTGPSYTVDTACNSSLSALEQAYKAIRSGNCEAAIVGGAQLCMHPYLSLLSNRAGFLAKDGKTKSFDEQGDGYARSETAAVLVLQKAKNAKRIYAQVVHAASNCEGYIEGNLYYRSPECQRKFLEQFYSEVNVKPSQVEYVEAFGCGLPNFDRAELEAFDQVFCKDRKDPLLVGSVKSNAGHAEAAAGVMAVTKVCLMYQAGKVPANLHCTEPMNTPGVSEGRIKIVTDNTPFHKGYVSVCGYAYSGNNCHVLFKGIKKPIKQVEHKESLPRLVVASGRTQSAVNKILDFLSSNTINDEAIALLHTIHEEDIPGLIYRGYNIVVTQDGKTKSLAKSSEYFPGVKRPIWFVYSGMGSQWSGMANDLMKIPVFAAAIEKCQRALEPKGLNLTQIITDQDPKMFDNILHSFVGIAAVQIGLTDVLSELGIKPDFVIGHSVGELGCAYADGCFTAEQMVLAAYSRGLASIETPFIRGSMAAVGIGYNEIKSICPREVEVACHNGPDSCTISGPAEAMQKFVTELTAMGIFAKEVPCSNIAYHSKYIAEAGPTLLKYLKEVIPSPSPRSERWLSTSVPQQQWSEPHAQSCSAEYHTNNLLSPVLFEETSRNIPANAITIEIAPHGLLQAILRRSLKKDCTNIPLTKRGHRDNVEFLLNAIGKLYEVGVNPKLANIYPKVGFPVSDNTPLLSQLVEWEHSDDWHTAGYEPMVLIKSGERHAVMSLHDDEYQYICGHVVNGINTFPAMAYLVFAWDTVARMVGVPYTDLSVVFEDIHFHSQAIISKNKPLELIINVQKATGNFEIIHKGANIVNGRIKRVKSKNVQFKNLPNEAKDESTESVILKREDIYKIFNLKGYTYSGLFKSVESYNSTKLQGKVNWDCNWVTFFESLLQVNDLVTGIDTIVRPKIIRRLAVNVREHKRILEEQNSSNKPLLDITVHPNYSCTKSAGVELEGLCIVKVPSKRDVIKPVFEKYEFVPHFGGEITEMKEGLSYTIQLAYQNYTSDGQYQVVELLDQNPSVKQISLSTLIREVFRNCPSSDYELTIAVESTSNVDSALPALQKLPKVDLFVGNNLLNRKKLLNQVYSILNRDGFVISREKLSPTQDHILPNFNLVSTVVMDHTYVILNKKVEYTKVRILRVKSEESFPWIERVQLEMSRCDRLVIVSEQDPLGGIIGLVNCLRAEKFGSRVQALVITDYSAPPFDADLPLYKDQIAKNLAINVYNEGKWGSYHHLPSIEPRVVVPYARLKMQRLGEINSLQWVEEDLAGLGNDTVQVYYSAMTYLDVQKATNRLHYESFDDINKNNVFGMEYCGRNSSGARVMGLVPSGGLATIVSPVNDLTWVVPDNWSMEDAVTVPQAYANAFYCLFLRRPVSPDPTVPTRILVHAGTGALGLAVINIALAYNWEVFTTVSTDEKKDFLLKTFPKLKEDHIGSSRDDSFENMVSLCTKGKQCNIVINSLSGRLREASERCVSQFGFMINLDKNDVFENSSFGMYQLAAHHDYLFTSLVNIFNKDEAHTRKRIHEMMTRGIAEGFVHPLPRTSFAHEDVSEAFRYMGNARHIGKVIIKMRHEEKIAKVQPKPRSIEAIPRSCYPADKSFLIITGASGLGIELADWLVKHGARKIVLHSTKSLENRYLAYKIHNWRSKGIEINLSNPDIRTNIGCKQLVADAARLAPIHGVYFLPQRTKQAPFENASPEDFAQEFRNLVVPVARLDGLTKMLCPQLKEFVIVSSQAWSRGSANGTADALAHSALHALMNARRKQDLPANIVLFGAMGQHELVTSDDWWDVEVLDTKRQSIGSVLETLSTLSKSPNVVSTCHLPSKDEVKRATVFEVFEDILGKKLLKEAPEDRSFEDMGVDHLTAKQISAVLAREYNIFYTPDFIQRISVTKLRQLQNELENEMGGRIRSGLTDLYPNLEAEEYNATEPVMRMPTLISDGNETEDQFTYEDTFVWMIPGLHGHRSIFNSVCRRLKTKAWAIQYGLDNPSASAPEIAQNMYKIVKIRQRDPNFKLFAYSFGVSVALELAQLLENDGYVGKIFCLDGGPEYFKEILDQYFGSWSEAKLQNEVIKHVCSLLKCSKSEEIDKILTDSDDWEAKVEKCMVHMNTTLTYSIENQKSLLNTFYKQIVLARSNTYENTKPLKSEIVLIKANNGFESKDCGLSRYSQKPLKVYEIESDHGMAPYDLQCTAIVNRELGIDEVFKNVNNCKIYSLYSNSFY